MNIIHILIVPAMVLAFSIIIQDNFSQNDFFNYYKIYLFGILAGIIYAFLSSVIEMPFQGSAYIYSIITKSILRGILITLLTAAGLFILIEFFSEKNIYSSWSIASIFSFSYITGIYTIINIREIALNEYPSYLTPYLAFIPFLLVSSIIIGAALYLIVDSYNIIIKILWALLFTLITVMVIAVYNFLFFYGYIYIYLFIILFAILAAVFDLVDFKNFR